MAEEQLPLPFDARSKPPTRKQLSRWADDEEVELLFFDPPEHFDHAILGVVHGFGQEPAILYDQEKVLAAMAQDMAEDAEEWFSFNTIGAFLGEATPRFLIRPWDDDDAVTADEPDGTPTRAALEEEEPDE